MRLLRCVLVRKDMCRYKRKRNAQLSEHTCAACRGPQLDTDHMHT